VSWVDGNGLGRFLLLPDPLFSSSQFSFFSLHSGCAHLLSSFFFFRLFLMLLFFYSSQQIERGGDDELAVTGRLERIDERKKASGFG
jgi:hypothetical protein